MGQVKVYKGRTATVEINLPYDVSGDIITSEIRRGKNVGTPLIATWKIDFKTDGKDGDLILTLDDSVTVLITDVVGYMDLKRISHEEPVIVFDEPIPVLFKTVVTQ